MLLIVLGGAWVPPGLGTQSWSDANAFSGTLVGEFDGWLRPALNVYGGVVGERLGLTGSFSVASINSSQYAGTSSTHVVGAVRLGVDGRAYLRPRQPGMVNIWGNLGIDAVIPRAKDVSDAYTEQEQADADEASASTRAQMHGCDHADAADLREQRGAIIQFATLPCSHNNSPRHAGRGP